MSLEALGTLLPRTLPLKALHLLAATALVSACAPEPCTPPECDIRRASCQRELMKATACDRGVAPRDVPTRVISLEDFVQDALDHEEADERFTQEARAMALLGLQEEGTAAQILGAFYASVGAFYDRGLDEITVLERGEPLDGFAYSVMMVHEFSHALQQGVSLAATPTYYTLDAILARSAVFEGDATLTTDRAAVRLFGADPDEVHWRDVYRGWSKIERELLVSERYRVSLANRYFPYAFGSVFLEPVRRKTGQSSIARWLADPPNSTRAILAGSEGVADAEAFEVTAFESETAPPSPAMDAGVGAHDAAITPLLADTGATEAGMNGAGMNEAGMNEAGMNEAGAPDSGTSDAAPDAGRGGLPTELLVPELPGHRLLSVDRLGQFVYEVYAESVARRLPRQSPLIAELQRSGAELQADHLSLWVNDTTDAPAAVYRLRFADKALAEAWLAINAELQLGTHTVHAFVHSGDLVLVSSADEDWLAQLDLLQLSWRVMGATELQAELAMFHEPFAGAHVCSHKLAPLGW